MRRRVGTAPFAITARLAEYQWYIHKIELAFESKLFQELPEQLLREHLGYAVDNQNNLVKSNQIVKPSQIRLCNIKCKQ
jgi:hypothetical protein